MVKRIAAFIDGYGNVSAKEDDLNDLKENEVLIKVHASLISPGTEVGSIKNLSQTPDKEKEPFVFGYANAGEIVEIKGNSKGLEKGMRVAAMGAGAASHANYANVPVNLVVPIPDEVTYAQATYACLGATSLQAVRRAVPQLGEYGVILGLGIVGNLAAQLCMISGARVICWEGLENRIEIARECGIRNIANFKTQDTVEESKSFSEPYGADFAIMAFGGAADEAFQSTMKCMKVSADGHQMGRIVLVGGCQVNVGGGAASGNVNILAASRTGPGYHDPAYEYGSDYPAAFVQFTTQRNLREIIKLIAEKRLSVDPVTTHNMPLDEVGKAVDMLIDSPDKAMGIVLEMSH